MVWGGTGQSGAVSLTAVPITNAELAERVAGQTVPLEFLATVRARPESVALRSKEGDEYRTITYAEYADRAARLATALSDLGVGRGTRVVLLMRNRPEFHIADIGSLLVGATPISIYNSSSPEQISVLAGHCHAEVAIVEAGEFLDRLLEVRDSLPDLRHIVVLDGAPEGTIAWEEVLTADPVDLETAAHVATPDDLVTVIYTSGTTGEPKGVMLDHANICWTIESLRLALPFSTEGFRLVSYLPMAHIAERVVTHYGGLVNGYEVTTCPDLHFLASYLRETEPELLFGVPRTYEKVHSGIRAVLAADPAKSEEFDRALAVGLEVDAVRVQRRRSRHRPRPRVRGGRRGDAPTGAPAPRTRCTARRGHRGGADPRRDSAVLPRAGCAALGDVRTLGIVGPCHMGGQARAPRYRGARDSRPGAAPPRRR